MRISTQRELARYRVEERQAHYLFTVKANQRGLLDDLALYFEKRKDPEAVTVDHAHGRDPNRIPKFYITHLGVQMGRIVARQSSAP